MRRGDHSATGKKCGGEAKNTNGKVRTAPRSAGLVDSQKAGHPSGERPAVGGHGQLRSYARFGHTGKSMGVGNWAPADGDGYIIAAILTLFTDALAQPPNRRMVEEQRLHRKLE